MVPKQPVYLRLPAHRWQMVTLDDRLAEAARKEGLEMVKVPGAALRARSTLSSAPLADAIISRVSPPGVYLR